MRIWLVGRPDTVIGAYWLQHHYSGRIYAKSDHWFDVMNLLFHINAPIYARVRENTANPADNDLTRGLRQQRVLQAIAQRAADRAERAQLRQVLVDQGAAAAAALRLGPRAASRRRRPLHAPHRPPARRERRKARRSSPMNSVVATP